MAIDPSEKMTEKTFLKTRLYLTAIVTMATWSLLAWYYYHGGVPSHHILAREDLPEISNWWGAILLPTLTWFLLYRIQKRLFQKDDKNEALLKRYKNARYGFTASLLFGIVLSTFFALGNVDVPGDMLLGLLVLALFLPIYRAECLLGFVIGMTFTFGTVLPTGIGSILASIGAVLYLLVRPAILFITSKLVQLVSPNRNGR